VSGSGKEGAITRLIQIVTVLVLAVRAAVPQATPVRVADQSCESCHRAIYRSYLGTPMANASGAAADKLIPGTFTQKASDVQYTLGATGGNATISWRALEDPKLSGQWTLSYFLGSGHLGTTWLYSQDQYVFESPVAWYAASRGYDMKPGLENAREMPPALPMQSGCLRCHMSAVQPSDAGTINRYGGLAFLHTGITCEECHGDTEQHVRTGGKAAVVNPARLDATLRDSVCISCHLEGDITVERAGHAALDYRPGQAIGNYLAYYVYAKNDPTARGVSEVEQLSQSTCKRMSGDRMSCMSCHDPHFTPGPAQRVAFYRGKCLACHSTAQFARTHHPENPDCTSCHMPRNGAQNIPHVAWTDHRILRVPEAGPPAGSASVKDELEPIFSPGASKRDQGMAWYLAFLEGNRAAGAKAWSLLEAEQASMGNDAAGLDALGVLRVERGDAKAAEAAFRQVLSLNADDLTALSNLGTLLAKQGKLAESVALMRRAFERNRDVAGLAMNLARAECMAGDAAGMRDTLQSALTYNPGIAPMRQMMERASGCSGPKLEDLKP
jgi:predicted CXXCH cytochrome family protein